MVWISLLQLLKSLLLQMLVHVVLVLLLVNMFAAGECVARIYCECSVVGDTDCFSVVVII